MTDKFENGNLTGTYLITHSNFVMADYPEIFLLLQDDDVLIGICVNIPYSSPDKNTGKYKIQFSSDIGNLFESEIAEMLIPENINVPILNGGPDQQSELSCLHTFYEGAKNFQEYNAKLYNISAIKDFQRTVSNQSFPQCLSFFYGRYNVNLPHLVSEISSGNWELRRGFHAMTYGASLGNKYKHIDKLTESVETVNKIGEFDLGNFFNTTVDLFHEVMPALMCRGAYGYYKNCTDLNEEQIIEAIRIGIAVAEVNGNDLMSVMEKYTHEEIINKYHEMRDSGFEFKLLKEFDERRAMLLDLGLNPIFYDAHLTEVVFELSKAREDPNWKQGEKSMQLEGRLGQIGEIVKKEV